MLVLLDVVILCLIEKVQVRLTFYLFNVSLR